MSDTFCELCKKNFYDKYSLMRHRGRKTSCIKNKICPKCDKEFGSPYHLKRHLDRQNSCVPDQVCNTCNTKYNNTMLLTEHNKLCLENQRLRSIIIKIPKSHNNSKKLFRSNSI